MDSVLVTGATGFIGRHLVPALAARGHRVVRLSRTPAPGATVAALHDAPALTGLLRGIGTVVHLAATTGKAPRTDYFRTNVDATATLLRAAEQAGVARFIHVSSIAVACADKRRCWYAQSKEAAERLVLGSTLATTIVRPTQVFGPGSALLAALRRLARLPVVPAFDGGHARLQPVFVIDLAEMLADVVDGGASGPEPVELGGPEVVTIREVLDRLHRRDHGRPARFGYVPIAPLALALAGLEGLSVRAVPFTVGQLAAFRFDGTAQAAAVWISRRKTLVRLDEMIERSFP